jgi:hypothetical protein
MIGTLAWKEYREQRSVWLAMAVLGLVLLLCMLTYVDSPNHTSPNRTDLALGTAAILVAFTYGLVCGAMLLAGEHESRTMTFLDILEGRRRRIWTTKVLMGAILTITEALVLAGLVVSLGLCRSVLAAVAVAAVLLVFASPAGMVAAHLIAGRFSPHTDMLVTVAAAALTMAALAGSALNFCLPDWQRRSGGFTIAHASRRAAPSGVRAILWLTCRQAPVGIVALTAASLVLGAAVPGNGLILWPVVSLLLGVGCGMAVFAGEEASEAHRFLGDQRLPVGRIWAVKTFCWLIVATLLAIVAFLSARAHFTTGTTQRMEDAWVRSVVERLAGPEVLRLIGRGTFLTLGLVYGFAFGQFLNRSAPMSSKSATCWKKAGRKAGRN